MRGSDGGGSGSEPDLCSDVVYSCLEMLMGDAVMSYGM